MDPLRRRELELEELRIFAEHHITRIRRSRRGREILAVKHAAFGWISPIQFYAMQEIHAALPKIIEGGYRLKEAIWSTEFEVEILASGIKAPAAIALVGGALAIAAIDAAQGNSLLSYLDLLALALPFGEIYLIWRGAIGAAEIAASTSKAVTDWAAAVGRDVPKAIADFAVAVPGSVGKAAGAVFDFFKALFSG